MTLVAVPAGYFLLPNSRSETPSPLDPLGAVLSIVGLGSLVYAIIEAPAVGWSDPEVVGAFAVAVLALSAFVGWQLRSEHPMLDVRFFQNRRFTAASMAITMVFFALFGSMFVITQRDGAPVSERSERARRRGLSGGGAWGADGAHWCSATIEVLGVVDDAMEHQ